MAIVLHGARILDGRATEPLGESTVVVDGGRITEVTKAAGARDTLIDCSGATVLPGLIDAHASIGQLKPEERPNGIDDRAVVFSAARAFRNGRAYLDSGVTTVRVDFVAHHGLFAVRDLIDAGHLPGPRMKLPGRAITATGGHAWMSGARQGDGPWEMARLVREEIKAGADWIKLMPTGGAGTPNEAVDEYQMTPQEIAAAVDAAHRRGKKVFAHVSAGDCASDCVDAGIDSIEHGFLLTEVAVQKMALARTPLVPTLSAYRHLVAAEQEGTLPTDAYTTSLWEAAASVVEAHAASFRAALAAGVPIVAGTDAGGEWFPPYMALQFELELMVSEGMAPAEAIRSATSRSAELLGLGASVGTIEVGMAADLIVVDGDPLADISALRRIRLVMKQGEIVFRAVSDRAT